MQKTDLLQTHDWCTPCITYFCRLSSDRRVLGWIRHLLPLLPARQSRHCLGTWSQHESCPAELARKAALRPWPSQLRSRLWPSITLNHGARAAKGTAKGTASTLPGHAWRAWLLHLPSCPGPLPSPQQILPLATPWPLQLALLSAHSCSREFLFQPGLQTRAEGRQARECRQ